MLDALFAGPAGPVVIFFLRIFDVSLATVRTLLIVRGHKRLVPFIGFVESMTWVFAVGSAIRNLESGWHVIGYAGGFAAGNAVGLWIEERLAFGLAAVRIVSRDAGQALAEALRAGGYGATQFTGMGRDGAVALIYSVVHRRRVSQVLDTVAALDDDAFVAVDEPRTIHRGWMFPRRGK